MKTIWKFPLEITDVQRVEMPAGAEILCAQQQNGVCVMWAICDDFNALPRVWRMILMASTGHPCPVGKYISTCQDGLGLVWHIFDGGE